MPLRVPMIDIHTIGAGGGSIARVNPAGILQVGPESAGSAPGPICYSRGGTQVTVTDANLLLGRINPVGITGASGRVDLGAIRFAIEEQIGRRLGLDADESAAAILAVAGEEIDALLHAQAERGRTLIRGEGVAIEHIDARHEVDLLYQDQTHVLRIPIASPGFSPDDVLRQFAARYRDRFDVELSEIRAMLVNVRTSVIGRRPKHDLQRLHIVTDNDSDVTVGDRHVYFDGGWRETAIYHRDRLAGDARIAGPAIIEQPDTTIVIDPGAIAQVDAWGNLIITV